MTAQPKKIGQAITPELLTKMSVAKTTEDWQKLASELAPTVAGILSGEVKASSAQASLIKDVMNRAYGRPVATQEEKKVSASVVILPALDTGMKMMICPKCGFDVSKDFVAAKPRPADGVSLVNS